MKNEARIPAVAVSPGTDRSTTNRLLTILPVHERNAVHRASSLQTFAAGEVILNAGSLSQHVIFPNEAVLSMTRSVRDGSTIQTGMVGSEGVAGCDGFMDARRQLDRIVVLAAGSAWCMPVHDVRRHFESGAILRRHLLRAASAYGTQVAQNVICGRFHAPAPRLARWLLMVSDRTSAKRVLVDRTTMADLLGFRTGEIEVALDELVGDGLVRITASSVNINDRDGLELASCECYEATGDILHETDSRFPA